MDNPLLLPLVIILVFWAYREVCYRVDAIAWREERWRMLHPLPEWGGGVASSISEYNDSSSPGIEPSAEPTPEQREAALERRLQQERLDGLNQARIAALTASSEKGFNALVGTGDADATV